MRIFFLPATALFLTVFISGPLPAPLYSVNKVPLPDELNKQVCISGMKYMDGKLYFASERCPVIFAADPSTGAIVNRLNIQAPQVFEMEGMTSYKGKLYLVSENTVAVYEVSPANGSLKTVQTSVALPPKSKEGDGMEGIAANETNNKFYLLRERNETMTQSQVLTFSVEEDKDGGAPVLKYESTIELPLQNPQWRYSDICYDRENARLICLKSYSKGKLRQQFLESIAIDTEGKLSASSLKNIPVENFSAVSNKYKDEDYSMNLEGITLDEAGNIYIISDNTSGKAVCDAPAKEKTILLQLKKI